ncbi:hypothetical protein HB780_00565 (plasmid) [Rhizobium lusitanum]|uniref:hypothetical protein n=1 Tax=Rhizobium lusitanum TaxID=293958 RepID=UPI00161A00DE|nr:hypothetical protein [Rhizobium lusitanum]QND44346.1 hypothetical protein HB780_00565 [Rhizobium lusitanum]
MTKIKAEHVLRLKLTPIEQVQTRGMIMQIKTALVHASSWCYNLVFDGVCYAVAAILALPRTDFGRAVLITQSKFRGE